MTYLYLDESGDLGFDFSKNKCSKYFTICILSVPSTSDNREIINAVKKTLKRKLNHKNSKRIVTELKGSKTSFVVKQYFWGLVKNTSFGIYAYTVNKSKIKKGISENHDRFYNWITRLVLDKIPLKLEKADRIELIIDKRKGKKQIIDFNEYIKRNLEAKIHPNTPLYIYHRDSSQSQGLQACDVFCWGIHKEIEDRDSEWLSVFKKKVRFNDVYLKRKERA